MVIFIIGLSQQRISTSTSGTGYAVLEAGCVKFLINKI